MAERFEDERALPRPELNPLLNPLLADNMGRWAEVYFTSAPEKVIRVAHVVHTHLAASSRPELQPIGAARESLTHLENGGPET